MTLSYVLSCYPIPKRDNIEKIDECIRKINQSHDTIEIDFRNDKIVFYFDDYELLANHLGEISHLINSGRDYNPSNITLDSETEYSMIIWS